MNSNYSILTDEILRPICGDLYIVIQVWLRIGFWLGIEDWLKISLSKWNSFSILQSISMKK